MASKFNKLTGYPIKISAMTFHLKVYFRTEVPNPLATGQYRSKGHFVLGGTERKKNPPAHVVTF